MFKSDTGAAAWEEMSEALTGDGSEWILLRENIWDARLMRDPFAALNRGSQLVLLNRFDLRITGLTGVVYVDIPLPWDECIALRSRKNLVSYPQDDLYIIDSDKEKG